MCIQGHFFQLVNYKFSLKLQKLSLFYERYFKINLRNMFFYSNSKFYRHTSMKYEIEKQAFIVQKLP